MKIKRSLLLALLAVTLAASAASAGIFGPDEGSYPGNAGSGAVTSRVVINPINGVSRVTSPGLFANCGTCVAGIEGNLCSVTDDLAACAFSATVTGSGTHHVLAYCDGTQWVMTECK